MSTTTAPRTITGHQQSSDLGKLKYRERRAASPSEYIASVPSNNAQKVNAKDGTTTYAGKSVSSRIELAPNATT